MKEIDRDAFDLQRNAILRKYRKKCSPTTLHHYTNFDAAKKILSTDRLRLSHAAFCNDPSELSHGLEIMRSAAIERDAKLVSETIAKARDLMLHKAQPYIFCLSESMDILPQWEMYAGRNGCCITFDKKIEQLTLSDPKLETHRPTIGSVIYETDRQQDCARELCDQICNAEEGGEMVPPSSVMVSLINVAVFFKAEAFRNEEEWRVVQLVNPVDSGLIQYHSGRRFPKPYVELHAVGDRLPVSKITIGPADDQERLVMSVRHLTKMKGHKEVKVGKSDIAVSPS